MSLNLKLVKSAMALRLVTLPDIIMVYVDGTAPGPLDDHSVGFSTNVSHYRANAPHFRDAQTDRAEHPKHHFHEEFSRGAFLSLYVSGCAPYPPISIPLELLELRFLFRFFDISVK